MPSELFEKLERLAFESERSLEDEALVALQRGVAAADLTLAGSPD
jgi:hypothetical protein